MKMPVSWRIGESLNGIYLSKREKSGCIEEILRK